MRPPPKVRLVSCHNLGVNDLCVATSMRYRAIEELAGRIRQGWWIVINDHHRGYNLKAMPLDSRSRRSSLRLHLAPDQARRNPHDDDLDFGLRNAPYFFSTFSASLLAHISAWLGAD